MQLTSVSTVFGWPWPSIINKLFLPTTIHDTWHHCPMSPPSPRHHHPHVTIVPNSHSHSQLPSTTYKHGTRPPTRCHVTSRNNHQDRPPQTMKKAQKRTQTTCSQMTASSYERTQATASRGETACLPPLISLTANPDATSPSATWQPDDGRRRRSLLLLGHHGEPPLSPIPPNPSYSDTGRHVARQGQRHHTET